jgi:hypothetical protein
MGYQARTAHAAASADSHAWVRWSSQPNSRLSHAVIAKPVPTTITALLGADALAGLHWG